MNHLLECPSSSDDPLAADCQCSRLRACEQRVRDEERAWKGAAALSAAREADSALDEGPKYLPYWIDREDALAAIDALWRDVIFGTMVAVPIIALLTWLAWQL